MPSQKSEDKLVKAAQNGDKQAFEILVRQTESMVYAMIMRQIGDKEIALELFQETYLRAYTRLSQFEFKSKFSSWLVRIALNVSANHFKSRAWKEEQLHEKSNQVDQELKTLSDISGQSLEEEKEEQHRLRIFREKLGSLAEHYRTVIVLCALEGKSYEEAASILEIPIGTVRSRLNKARLILQELTKDE